MLKKLLKRPRKPGFRDVVADDPTQAMEKFDEGLRRVLSAIKDRATKSSPPKKRPPR